MTHCVASYFVVIQGYHSLLGNVLYITCVPIRSKVLVVCAFELFVSVCPTCLLVTYNSSNQQFSKCKISMAGLLQGTSAASFLHYCLDCCFNSIWELQACLIIGTSLMDLEIHFRSVLYLLSSVYAF